MGTRPETVGRIRARAFHRGEPTQPDKTNGKHAWVQLQ